MILRNILKNNPLLVSSVRITRDMITIIRYGTPSITSRFVDLNSSSEEHLNQLFETGMLKFNNDMTSKVASHIQEFYFDKLKSDPSEDYKNENWMGVSELFTINNFREEYVQKGITYQAYISFLDPGLLPLITDPEILGVITKYLNRQPYFRNQPKIQEIDYKSGVKLSNGLFHVDHYRQISMMLLVSDVTMNDTHMEYYQGSNNRNMIKEGVNLSPDSCAQRVSGLNNDDIFHCIGKAGTLFVFDTSGFHRANYKAGNLRRILHLNINSGHHLSKFHDVKEDITSMLNPLKTKRYIRNFFNRIN